MEGKTRLGVLFGVFISIVVGIVLLSSISDTTSQAVNVATANKVNETHTLVNNLTISTYNRNLVAGNVFNWTTQVSNRTLLQAGNYTWASNGNFTLTQAGVAYVGANGDVALNYVYQPDEYVSDSTSRSLLSLIPLLFVIGLLALLLVWLYPQFKEWSGL